MIAPEVLLRRYLRQRQELGETEVVLDRYSPAALAGMLHPAAAERRAAPEASSGLGTQPPARSGEPPATAAVPVLPASRGSVGSTARVPTGTVPELETLPFERLRETALSCGGCALCETRTQVVFGEGDPSATVMVVGEAPGAEEDRTGRPFVGRAGKLLDLFLASIGCPRETVYICNVLKCRPPGNRNPAPAEIQACSGYLRRQVELVDPAVILAVGTFPAQTLLGASEPIGRLRGRVHQYEGRPLIPTYHPAAVLRNPSWIRPVWEDLQRLREVLENV